MVVGWRAGLGDVDGHRQVSADSFIVEARTGADDEVMEALDPGVVEADVMRGPPGCRTPRCGSTAPPTSPDRSRSRLPAGFGAQGSHHLAGYAFPFDRRRHDPVGLLTAPRERPDSPLTY